MFAASNIQYEISDRARGVSTGGIGAIHFLARRVGLIGVLDKSLHLPKRHLPYHESDHVLNIAYNIMAGNTRLEDIELLRQNEASIRRKLWLGLLRSERKCAIIEAARSRNGIDARANLISMAELLGEERYRALDRRPKYEIETQEREKRENVKERIVKEKEYENIRLKSEQVAEFMYRPGKCERDYRVIVLRKNLPRAEDRDDILRMEFKRFLNAIVCIPCQVIKGGHRILLRLLGYTSRLRLLFASLTAAARLNSG